MVGNFKDRICVHHNYTNGFLPECKKEQIKKNKKKNVNPAETTRQPSQSFNYVYNVCILFSTCSRVV